MWSELSLTPALLYVLLCDVCNDYSGSGCSGVCLAENERLNGVQGRKKNIDGEPSPSVKIDILKVRAV